MKKYLLLFLAVIHSGFSSSNHAVLKNLTLTIDYPTIGNRFLSPANAQAIYPNDIIDTLNQIKRLLQEQSPALTPIVIDHVLTTLNCAYYRQLPYNSRLTVIDYSRPSSEKRLWIFDLKQKKLLFYTYVSHGIKSGHLFSTYFSNRYNSRASSIGVYKTKQAYYGREGLSLRLDGLDKNFNDNASNRAVVMHPAWYVEEPFIKKYGRSGRSWGCPALPSTQASAIINTIKDDTLVVIYYPSESWFLKSTFLNCNQLSSSFTHHPISLIIDAKAIEELPKTILFIDLNNNNKHDDTEPVVAITADNYQQLFQKNVPLDQMIRRTINSVAYIALTIDEFRSIVANKLLLVNENNRFNGLSFVTPILKIHHGYAATEMKLLNLGTISDVKLIDNLLPPTNKKIVSIINIQGKPSFYLKDTNQFIRWIGL